MHYKSANRKMAQFICSDIARRTTVTWSVTLVATRNEHATSGKHRPTGFNIENPRTKQR